MDLLIYILQSLMTFFYSHFSSWGLAILVLTLAVRIVLFPFQWFQFQQQTKLKALQPAIDAVTLKHKDDPLRLFQEIGWLKKNAGIKTSVLFLVSLIQMPLFYGMYRLIADFKSLEASQFLWIQSLATPDIFFILPILSALAIYLQMRKSGSEKESPTMDWMKKLLPAISFVFMIAMPAGVVLYSAASAFLQWGGEALLRRTLG